MPSFAPPSVPIGKIKLTGVTAANTAITIPANCMIDDIIVVNTTGNAITGGLKFGTTAGAADVCASVAVTGTSISYITDALFLKRTFSTSASQQIFFDAVTLWNGASVDVTVVYKQL